MSSLRKVFIGLLGIRSVEATQYGANPNSVGSVVALGPYRNVTATSSINSYNATGSPPDTFLPVITTSIGKSSIQPPANGSAYDNSASQTQPALANSQSQYYNDTSRTRPTAFPYSTHGSGIARPSGARPPKYANSTGSSSPTIPAYHSGSLGLTRQTGAGIPKFANSTTTLTAVLTALYRNSTSYLTSTISSTITETLRPGEPAMITLRPSRSSSSISTPSVFATSLQAAAQVEGPISMSTRVSYTSTPATANQAAAFVVGPLVSPTIGNPLTPASPATDNMPTSVASSPSPPEAATINMPALVVSGPSPPETATANMPGSVASGPSPPETATANMPASVASGPSPPAAPHSTIQLASPSTVMRAAALVIPTSTTSEVSRSHLDEMVSQTPGGAQDLQGSTSTPPSTLQQSPHAISNSALQISQPPASVTVPSASAENNSPATPHKANGSSSVASASTLVDSASPSSPSVSATEAQTSLEPTGAPKSTPASMVPLTGSRAAVGSGVSEPSSSAVMSPYTSSSTLFTSPASTISTMVPTPVSSSSSGIQGVSATTIAASGTGILYSNNAMSQFRERKEWTGVILALLTSIFFF
ncbi:MAG: hypothetical protein M1828_000758 [Chrysothrix sp. TS-e1954]|nr:MAG: hypothetical protein M1828_000758 [Chrysothrix sp. TS-e1954]